MLGAMLPGVVPDIVLVLVENEGWVGLRDPPSALFDLMFELVRSPAGVFEGDENLCWVVVPSPALSLVCSNCLTASAPRRQTQLARPRWRD
jgi:hypothetical protein